MQMQKEHDNMPHNEMNLVLKIQTHELCKILPIILGPKGLPRKYLLNLRCPLWEEGSLIGSGIPLQIIMNENMENFPETYSTISYSYVFQLFFDSGV